MTTMTPKIDVAMKPVSASSNGSPAHAHADIFHPADVFAPRHIGPGDADIQTMLKLVGLSSLEELADQTVPEAIRLRRGLYLHGLPETRVRGEHELLAELKSIAGQNKIFRSLMGMGYHDTITPPVILRNIIENPGWYTQYTPYQAEIAQGRLEALLNFQTMISDLTGLPLAGASLLDEGTAAAEAMAMCWSIAGGHSGTRHVFFVASDCHPQTIAVCKTRADNMGIRLVVGSVTELQRLVTVGLGAKPDEVCGALLQYPTSDGRIEDYKSLIQQVHAAGAQVVMAADLLALTLITPPGELGADVAVGSAQRFGVPMGAGGPHAAYIATRPEHARKLPGRLIGVSRDMQGNTALRMAIQTREQHIRREKATSNICTAQALLAICASMYAVYHGPEGVTRIARRVHAHAAALASALKRGGHQVPETFFDTLRVKPVKKSASDVHAAARAKSMNLREYADGTVGVTLDECSSLDEVARVCDCFGVAFDAAVDAGQKTVDAASAALAKAAGRTSHFLTHTVFNTHHSETEMLRYIFRLMGRDLSLAQSMIPLGSCTMKLNATSEMIPVTWPEFGRIHPFAPVDQQKGYQILFQQLESWLSEITGFSAVSLQPNAGSQGEYAGLLVIRAYHHARGEAHRDVCLIPESAHGTNPASAVVAGFKVVGVANKDNGDIDVDDLKAKIAEHKANLGALMVTYPSTYGVFEGHIKEICQLVHDAGGQVYMDGANMNAQVGLCRPGDIGADVCHLNLHKTFCIPHGGGGPGMGPIGVAKHLAPFLPGHPVQKPASSGDKAIGPVSAAPYGSPSILTISWVYIALMGPAGLRRATQVAILNANYMAKRLEKHYDVLFKGQNGRCAHEFIIDVRPFDKSCGIKSEDIAKRLMDYGFHAPTMSWPVPNTLMIEPTESEPKEELDRFCDAMIAIREEIRLIEQGKMDKLDNPLKNAPHTQFVCTAESWNHPYSREVAGFPAPWLKAGKFWPSVGRVDNPYGDRNLVCTCPPMSAYGA